MSDATEQLEIGAPITTVWRLLREEAQLGIDNGRVVLVAEERPRSLVIDVRMGFMFHVRHAYRLQRVAHEEGCSIIDELRPFGLRWSLSNLFLFGKGSNAIVAAAGQGLQNLKEVAESEGQDLTR